MSARIPVGRSTFGTYVSTVCGNEAFVPSPLSQSLVLDNAVQKALDEAGSALAALSQAYGSVHLQGVLGGMLCQQEAVASLSIDGKSVPLFDLYGFRAGMPSATHCEYAYLADLLAETLEDALASTRESLTKEAILTMHLRLFADRAESREIGMLRRSQTWVGGDIPQRASYVPPPPQYIGKCLRDYIAFIGAASNLPALVRVAMAHYYFEAIHPLFHGNGVIGRIRVALLLKKYGLVTGPVLALSETISLDVDGYNEALAGVSKRGDMSSWLCFFLTAVAQQAESDRCRVAALDALYTEYEERLVKVPCKVPEKKLLALLFDNPIVTRDRVQRALGDKYSRPWVTIERLRSTGVVDDLPPGNVRGAYCALKLMRLLETHQLKPTHGGQVDSDARSSVSARQR